MSGVDWLIARPIAHRGLHGTGVVENTPSAFAAAIEHNYAIECDLQISGDGEAMVFHDQTLERLTDGAGRLDATTSSELKRVPFRSTDDRMITVGELCDLVAGRVTLVIELKSRFEGNVQLAARAASVLSAYQGPVALMSFDPAQMTALRALAPALTRGIVAESRRPTKGERFSLLRMFSYARETQRSRPQFIAYSVQDLPAALPHAARAILGMPLLTWTVRTDADLARARRYADQIIFEQLRP